MHIGEQAESLAQRGRLAEALSLLNKAAARNDPAALTELAFWRLSGRFLTRDLGTSRQLFRQAARAGSEDALPIYTAFLANGTGGPARWAEAVQLLRDRSKSDRKAARELEVIEKMELGPDGEPGNIPASKVVSSSPHVQMFRGVFTAAECRFLIQVAEPLMEPALIVDPRTGRPLRNPIRTSDSAAFPLAYESPAIHALNRRLAALSKTPVTHGEPLQVLRYRPGQQYRTHSDALPGVDNQRIVTVLVYLNDGFTGGETHFLTNGLSLKGEVGDAVLFRNVRLDGRPDDMAAHAGLPVTRGVKLIASRWIRERPLSLEASPS